MQSSIFVSFGYCSVRYSVNTIAIEDLEITNEIFQLFSFGRNAEFDILHIFKVNDPLLQFSLGNLSWSHDITSTKMFLMEKLDICTDSKFDNPPRSTLCTTAADAAWSVDVADADGHSAVIRRRDDDVST